MRLKHGPRYLSPGLLVTLTLALLMSASSPGGELPYDMPELVPWTAPETGSRQNVRIAQYRIDKLITKKSFQKKSKDPMMNLLPLPQELRIGPDEFYVTHQTRLYLPADLETPEWLAVQRLLDLWESTGDVRPRIDRLGLQPGPAEAALYFQLKDPVETDPRLKDGYELIIEKNMVQLTGNSSSGLFCGIQTLSQLVRHYGHRLPGCEITDEPDFAYRGFYHDVARGKVPKLETLKWLVDRLAELKINMFQLYIEHTFAFRFDPEIAQEASPLLPEEILELDQYCRDRRIDLVPSLQSFGHMAGILSLPRYRHLADVELTRSWDELSWHDRMVGATINTNDPDALALLEKMHDHYLPLFESKYVNVCADETYDLGKGKTRELAEEIGKGRLYLRHVNYLNRLVAKHEKRMMFWGDIVKHHPDLVPEIPRNAILLNWGYHRDTDYDSTQLFTDTGLDVFVCPGVSGWNRILNGVNNADLNIRRYAEAGKKYGAVGLLNTDWGDHGHYNLLAGSFHGIVLGAAMAWNIEGPEPDEFDRRWGALYFDDPEGDTAEALRAQSFLADDYGTWILFYQPWDELKRLEKITDKEARKLERLGKRGAKVFEKLLKKGQGDALINDELRHASMMNSLFGEKILLIRRLAENEGRPNVRLAKKLEYFTERLEILYGEYEVLWRTRNKESELRKIGEKIHALIAEGRARALTLRGYEGQ